MTLRGVLHNYNCMRVDQGKDFTKDDFLVVVVCDGYDRIPESFKALAREKGFLDEDLLINKGFMKQDPRNGTYKMKPLRDIMDDEVPNDKVPGNLLHIFQVTTWDFGMTDDVLKSRRINFMFAIKHRNDGKINSHKWFFQGVCKYLKPEYCLMLDIGTKPTENALLKLYNFMQIDKHCGGCCGEIEVDLSETATTEAYMLQVSQFYEYKLGHTPDKCAESFFGFTSVLPGAYSLFRWKAIKGPPLDMFFKNTTREDIPTCPEANEYLAEDRIMCLQIYIKEGTGYTVQYVPDAKAVTDAPNSIIALMKQRRRWMNGALFGTAKVISNFVNMISFSRNDHPNWRQAMMVLFMSFLTALFVFQFLIIGATVASVIVFLASVIDIIVKNNLDPDAYGFWANIVDSKIVMKVFFGAYFFLCSVATFVSLGLPVDRGMSYFKPTAIILSIL
jgi:cellulose synthase/poly-beta-1,6-N-acetylglucosamine synthase-like glycosyltransferase